MNFRFGERIHVIALLVIRPSYSFLHQVSSFDTIFVVAWRPESQVCACAQLHLCIDICLHDVVFFAVFISVLRFAVITCAAVHAEQRRQRQGRCAGAVAGGE